MNSSPEQYPKTEPSPDMDEWAFTPDAGMSEQLVQYLDTLVSTHERKELTDPERQILLNVHFSFAHSQGSVPGQQAIMEYQRRHLPPMTHDEIEQTAERVLVELASYSKFKPPVKHTKTFGTPDEMLPEQRRRMVVMEYYQRMNDWEATMKCETSPLELEYDSIEEDELLPLHELSDQQLIAQITHNILKRDLEYVQSGRPDRQTDAERYKSFFREYTLNSRHVPTPELQQMHKDVAAFIQRMDHETPEQLGVKPQDIEIIRQKYQMLTHEWEYKNYGQQFDLQSPVKKEYDFEAHRKSFHEKIYAIRQNAINQLSKGYELSDDLNANNKRIRKYMEKDPNFLSMHDSLMEASKGRIDELVATKELPEPEQQSLHKKLTEKLSSEIGYCDPNEIGDRSFDNYIQPVLEHKFQIELEDQEKAQEQQARFKEVSSARREKTQVLGRHSLVDSMVIAQPVPKREISVQDKTQQLRELLPQPKAQNIELEREIEL